MINGRYTLADLSKRFKIPVKQIRNIAPVITGAEKLHNDRKVLCWTFPESSIPEIAKLLGVEPDSEGASVNKIEEKEKKTENQSGGEGEADPPESPEEPNSSGRKSEEGLTEGMIDLDSPWIGLALIGLGILGLFRLMKK